jgi:hypothetical protein
MMTKGIGMHPILILFKLKLEEKILDHTLHELTCKKTINPSIAP